MLNSNWLVIFAKFTMAFPNLSTSSTGKSAGGVDVTSSLLSCMALPRPGSCLFFGSSSVFGEVPVSFGLYVVERERVSV